MNVERVFQRAAVRLQRLFGRRLGAFLADRSGVAAAEYAVVLGLIGAASIGAVSTLGQGVQTTFVQVGLALDASPEMIAMPYEASGPRSESISPPPPPPPGP